MHIPNIDQQNPTSQYQVMYKNYTSLKTRYPLISRYLDNTFINNQLARMPHNTRYRTISHIYHELQNMQNPQDNFYTLLTAASRTKNKPTPYSIEENAILDIIIDDITSLVFKAQITNIADQINKMQYTAHNNQPTAHTTLGATVLPYREGGSIIEHHEHLQHQYPTTYSLINAAFISLENSRKCNPNHPHVDPKIFHPFISTIYITASKQSTSQRTVIYDNLFQSIKSIIMTTPARSYEDRLFIQYYLSHVFSIIKKDHTSNNQDHDKASEIIPDPPIEAIDLTIYNRRGLKRPYSSAGSVTDHYTASSTNLPKLEELMNLPPSQSNNIADQLSAHSSQDTADKTTKVSSHQKSSELLNYSENLKKQYPAVYNILNKALLSLQKSKKFNSNVDVKIYEMIASIIHLKLTLKEKLLISPRTTYDQLKQALTYIIDAVPDAHKTCFFIKYCLSTLQKHRASEIIPDPPIEAIDLTIHNRRGLKRPYSSAGSITDTASSSNLPKPDEIINLVKNESNNITKKRPKKKTINEIADFLQSKTPNSHCANIKCSSPFSVCSKQ